MIDFQAIAARLVAGSVPRVLGVLEYSALDRAPSLLPAHFVTPIDEDVTPNRMAGGIIDQRVTSRFQVIIVVAANAARAERPSDELTQLIGKVKDLLIGWTVPGTATPIEYAGGRLLSAGGREAVWAVRFRTAYHERKPVQ